MSMAMGGNQGQMDEINVTPLIDVVLVLLIIFMVLTPITVEKMATQLPPEDVEPTPPTPDQPDQLMVAVYKDGTIALNLQAMSDEELASQLNRRLRSRATKTVFVDAHPEANYARVIGVMDLARGAGAEHVGFADLKEEGPAQLAPGTVLDPNAPPGTAVPGAASGTPPLPVTP